MSSRVQGEHQGNGVPANHQFASAAARALHDKEKDAGADIRVSKTPPPAPDADVIIVGGGPAGLSAALILARANRKVFIFDSGCKRNDASQTQHAILGADGEARADYLARARDQVLKYPTVTFYQAAVVDINIDAARVLQCKDTKLPNNQKVTQTWSFEVFAEPDEGGGCEKYRSKKLILATGVRDLIPDIEGFEEYWAKGIWVCLYCDGYEYNGKKLGAYGNGERGVHLALEMLLWSDNVVLFTNGEALVATDKERLLLQQHRVDVIEKEISRAYGNEDESHLGGVELEDGHCIALDALFFNTGRFQSSSLPAQMGLKADDRGDLVCEARGNVECVHGLYAAGNCAAAPLKLVMTAASQGAITGAKINSELMYEGLGLDDNPGPAGKGESNWQDAVVAGGNNCSGED